MEQEILRAIAPAIAFFGWLYLVNSTRFRTIKWVSLYFFSYAFFSSNFTFIYRDIHQAIQIVFIAIFIDKIIRSRQIPKINFVFFLFLIFVSASLIRSGLDDDAKAQLINLLVSLGVCNYLFSSLKNDRRLGLLLEFIGGVSLFVAIIGIIEFILSDNSRVQGTFSNSNYFGLFVGLGFCLVFSKWQGWRRNFALALMLFSIILCGSRSALLLPLLQYSWFLYRERNINKLLLYFFALATCLAVVIGTGISRFSNTDETKSSDAERFIFADIAMSMANDHPFTGVGWGRFISEFGNYSSRSIVITLDEGDVDATNQDRRVTHNDFLRILAELGWPALVVSTAFLIFVLNIVLRKRYSNSECLTPIWIGLILFSIGHNNLNNALFWFFALIPYLIYSNEKFSKPLRV